MAPREFTTLIEDALRPARTRNAAATRAAILDAARARFGREGYDEVGMRDLARDVGVDAAMVSRYFGSKEELFAEALRSCSGGARSLTETDRAEFGRIIARQLIYDPQNCDKFSGLLIMLRATGSAKATEIIQRFITDDFIKPLQEWLGGDLAEARARLVSSLIMGVALSRSLSGDFPLDAASKAAMCEQLGDLLQTCVDA